MTLDTVDDGAASTDLVESTSIDFSSLDSSSSSPLTWSLSDFVSEFGEELLSSLNSTNPPVYTGCPHPHRVQVLENLKRRLFPAQAEVVHTATELLINRNERAVFINGEMGCGKTVIGIAVAAV